MTNETIPLPSVPAWVVVAALLASAVWSGFAMSQIGPYNRMKARTTGLPIHSLPPRPVLQIEFARGPEDVESVLEVGHPSEEANIADMRAGNELDSTRLIPGYTLLLVALTLLIARGNRSTGVRLFRACVTVAIVIAVADFTENYGIARLLDALAAGTAITTGAVRLVAIPAFVKWTFLGLIGVALGVVTRLQESWRRWLSPVLLAGGVWTLATVWRHLVDRVFG